MEECLKSFVEFKDCFFLFSHSNSDPCNKNLNKMLKTASKKNKNIIFFEKLDYTHYINLMRHSLGVLGNSSSGIIEVPSFGKGSINIGERQEGRVQAKSVINVECEFNSIKNGIKKLYESEFNLTLKNIKNPYEKVDTIKNIIHVLKTVEIENINQLKQLIGLKFKRILFDNMKTSQIKKCLKLCRNKYQTEYSGNASLKNIKQISKTGINRISVGAITHSAKSFDTTLLFR